MALVLYNSLTNKVEEFKPINGNKVNMYVCGPTVYGYIHIGNARPVIFYDMLRRYLAFSGYDVTYASNITDVDDKIINKAISENTTEKVVAKMFEDAYWDSVERVGSSKPDLIPHATDYINEMIELIEDLIQKGYAYVSSGDVFFRVSKIKDYGCLSNQQIEELNSGARISVDDKKENPLDFALWKKTEVGIKWDSPFGSGRPGWHTECVVMNHKLFGDVIDIHGGGMDLKFPHHENEIAQAEAAYGTHLAKYWIHVGRLDLNGVKMSKSLGNVIYVKDIDNTHDGMVLRCLILFSPYRQMIPYSMDLFNQYAKEYDKWVRAYKQCLFELQYKGLLKDEVDPSLIDEFKKYMDDDFNVQNVLTLINNIVKVMNTSLRAKDYDTLALKLHTLEVILDVLHINLFVDKMTEEQLAVYKEWQEARLNKDFEKADTARAKLVEWKLV
ncbi:MAG: cysteine--tRNA ligase [Anaeroplasma sp.]|uniref:cysteine--tRNA ligase n=1 Tax=Anaeroplasma sp. TaxID=1872523 RepID=UPI002A91724F|nr:cysteine--tRNA ligase [Anaeroplasma sp.]MDY5983059.1 cysteine--tRNA ligase [Anaeroplasma sp.]